MNYRHAFHAGNHGDVLKHVVLSRVLTYMTAKDAKLAVLDAHAGIGRYDLSSLEAFKTGEWRGGIGKVLTTHFDYHVATLLKPYLDCVRGSNPDGLLRQYPGSPEIVRHLLRSDDRLLLNELHPQDYETLAARFAGIAKTQVSNVDAGQAVRAALPFLEKRGVVLIDPAFEVTDETDRVARMVAQGLNRMAQTCFVVWYPVTSDAFAKDFVAALDVSLAKSALCVELRVREAVEGGGLAGSGVVAINPPWTLFQELEILMPALVQTLGKSFSLTWLKQGKA
jgi:23S rRNA (adenine2030-N6)-methyltransferase